MAEFDVLFVCTGNICRSPMGEQMLADALARHLGPDAERFRVHSAGTHGLVDHPINPPAADVLSARGVAVRDFRARRLITDLVANADLVLCATRQHRSAAVTLFPRGASRSFTIKEFARLAQLVAPEAIAADDPVERARQLVPAVAAKRGMVHVPPHEDDVADPYGGPVAEYVTAADEIAAALAVPVTLICSPPGGDR